MLCFVYFSVVGYYLESMEISYRYFTSYCQHKGIKTHNICNSKANKQGI